MKKQLAVLFFSNFIVYVIGMGLFPVLPLYAAEFSATAAMVGLYMALVYIAITSGSLAVGWIPANVSRKAAFVVVGAAGIPSLLLLGRATAFWQVVLHTAVIWFSGGFATSLVGLFTGLLVEEKERGRSFSLMFLARPLAGIFGGAIVAWLVSWGGYRPTFTAMALIWTLMPLTGLIGLPDLRAQKTKAEPGQAETPATEEREIEFGWQFYVLLLVVFLTMIAAYNSRLSISLSLIALNFDAADAASIAIASSIITLPLVPLIGTLSDRLGRYRFLMLSSLMTTVGSMILLFAGQLWQFWLAGGLLLASMTVTGSVSSAMGTDLLSSRALGRGLPRLNAASWVSGVVGLLSAGLLVDALGTQAPYVVAIVFSLAATGLIIELSPRPLYVPAAAVAVEAPVPSRSFEECLDEAGQYTMPCSEMA